MRNLAMKRVVLAVVIGSWVHAQDRDWTNDGCGALGCRSLTPQPDDPYGNGLGIFHTPSRVYQPEENHFREPDWHFRAPEEVYRPTYTVPPPFTPAPDFFRPDISHSAPVPGFGEPVVSHSKPVAAERSTPNFFEPVAGFFKAVDGFFRSSSSSESDGGHFATVKSFLATTIFEPLQQRTPDLIASAGTHFEAVRNFFATNIFEPTMHIFGSSNDGQVKLGRSAQDDALFRRAFLMVGEERTFTEASAFPGRTPTPQDDSAFLRQAYAMLGGQKVSAGPNCFVAGTPVQVPFAEGPSQTRAGPGGVSIRAIETISAGDFVLAKDPVSSNIQPRKVLRVTKRVAPEVIKVFLSSDAPSPVIEEITATPEHSFYVAGRGFIPLGTLGIGTEIVTRAGPRLVIRSVDRQVSESGFAVYNFEVESDHTYFVGHAAGGLWVHNGDCPKNNAPTEYVNLADQRATNHVLIGEIYLRSNGMPIGTGGGHSFGLGIPGKSEFPASWSDDKIMHTISDVATDPTSRVTMQGRTTKIEGVREGLNIKVLVRDQRIVSGYPTNVPKNP